jgi:4-amino-4-deoxy-L-arabinose transferase-like glycosyltransferase
VLVGGVVLLLLFGTGLLVATIHTRSPSELVLTAYVVAFGEIVGLSLFLSAFDSLTRSALIAGTTVIFVGVVAVWLLAGAPRPHLIAGRRDWRPPVGPVRLLAIVVALALAYVVALIVATPPNGWDPLNYHLARAAFWLQSGSVEYIGAAYDERLNFNPPNGEIGLAFALGVTRDEHAAGFVQLIAALACAVGVFAVARRVGLSRNAAAFGALLFLTLPIVILQSSGVKNDLVVASFLLAAAVFLLGDSPGSIVLASLATALAVGTKFTAAYGLVILFALALIAAPRQRRRQRVAGLALGAAAGSYWYAVNAVETGHVLGDQSNVPGLTALLRPPENLLNLFGLAVDTLDVSGAEGRDILFFVGAALLGAIGLALARRGRHSLIVAAVLCSPLALLVVSEQVGRPAVLELSDLLGTPQAYLAVGDETSSSPTTASDTASWFGPLGVLLVVGVALAATAFFKRGLPMIGRALALAPLLWLAMVALTLTYHPWEGRFFVFPVALSAAVWGIALRAPAVAWSLAAVAALTVTLSLVHYVEKPSGVQLLDRSPTTSVWAQERWGVQSQHDPTLAPVLRFLDDEVPRHDSIGLALGANDFGYPAFGPRLTRRVELLPFGSNGRDVDVMWVLVNTERSAELDSACWRAVLRSESGSVFSRTTECS